MAESEYSIEEASQQAGVPVETLEHWAGEGIIPEYRGESWTPAAIAHARIVRKLRDRGHTYEVIKRETEQGRLSFAFVEELFRAPDAVHDVAYAAEKADMDPALLGKILKTAGFNSEMLETLTDEDIGLISGLGMVLKAGFPLDAVTQLARVYGQSLAQIAESEVRLFHMFVHEPMIRAGAEGGDMAAGMEGMLSGLMPVAGKMLDYVHRRFLQQFIEQNIITMLEANLQERDLGRLPVAIAFADLAGYTRLTEEEGEELAFEAVEKFVESVEATLPDSARIKKTIGDEVMVVGTDAAALVKWAVEYQDTHGERPFPRIGIHYGETLYRDGDYYGSDVNQAARVAARAAGREVLVTRQVVDTAEAGLDIERIGEVRLKGFTEATELFLARSDQEE